MYATKKIQKNINSQASAHLGSEQPEVSYSQDNLPCAALPPRPKMMKIQTQIIITIILLSPSGDLGISLV